MPGDPAEHTTGRIVMDTHFEQTLPRSPARPELSLPDEHEQISTLHAEPKDRLGASQIGSATSDDDHEAGEKPAPTARVRTQRRGR